MEEKNEYLVGDNEELLKSLPDGHYQLVYIDPPYNTGRDFGDFVDKFDDIHDFISFIRPKVELIHQKLKDSGTLVYHADMNTIHYVKVMLDEIFSIKNFLNEVIWKTTGNKKPKSKLQRGHDTILVYSKTPKNKINMQYIPFDEDYLAKMKKDDVGYYTTSPAVNSQPDVIVRKNLRYNWNGHEKQWWVSESKMKELHSNNRLVYNENGIPRIKRYSHESQGITMRDLWDDIPSLQLNEKLGYATQKPVALLERIVTLYTDENDFCLDCFAGSGTLGRACFNLNRNYTLIDINPKGKNTFLESLPANLNEFMM